MSFSVHMCFESSVSFLLLACRKDALWFLYRSLKFVASPTYESVVVSVVTVAWYSVGRPQFVSSWACFFKGAFIFLSAVTCLITFLWCGGSAIGE